MPNTTTDPKKKKHKDTAASQKRTKDTAGKKDKHNDRGTGHNQVAKVTGEMAHLNLGSSKRAASPARPKTGTPVDFRVHGYALRGSLLKISHMASTGTASAPTGSSEPVTLQGSGFGVRLVAHVTIANRTVKAIMDTGAGYTLFHRSVFPNPQYLAARHVPGSKLYYNFAALGSTGWKSGDGHVDTLRLRRRGGSYEVRNFMFYVVDDPHFEGELQGLLGFGPAYQIPRGDNVVEYAPSIFNHIVDQESLAHRTMSLYISRWVENHPYTFAADIKIGVDPEHAGVVWQNSSSAQSAAHLHSLDVKLALESRSGRERDIIPRENDGTYNYGDVTAITDTGTPGISLSTKMFDAACAVLESMQIDLQRVRNGNETLIEVPDTQTEKVKSLIVKIGTIRQKVPSQELWFPSSPPNPLPHYQNHTRMVLIGQTQQLPYDVGLGAPYSHLRTQMLDRPSDPDPRRRRIGFISQ